MSTLKFSVSITREEWEKLVYLHGAYHYPPPSPSAIFQNGVSDAIRYIDGNGHPEELGVVTQR